uniref:NADH:ubiquinone reductase (H(+)-translocating) n=1 Tax=Rhodobothrium cf. paucitesticulare DJM-2021 TaxID=2899513 RepID=A0A8K1SXS1_9CEST|nr:NADH dehydrogenase subunit 5 [Rhodobothrium cf. paucitesticulare DJM-2021]
MLFYTFILLILLSGSLICMGDSWVALFNNLTLNGSVWNPILSLDLTTSLVLLMLSICFGYAFFYTGHYFGGDLWGIHLNKIIASFVAVMFSLVLTGDFLSTLVFWEYLGVVSFFLILFYMNYLSLRSSIVTLVSSRFGDVCLFLLIAMMWYNTYSALLITIVFFFIVLTKSASFPFISWLLEAMRAPTPVSSLVHSSTLVAAGVWFSMRYDMFLFYNDSFIFLLILLTTIFITGVCCFFFLDLKKIVALSTCNNISWCLFYLICGDVTLSLFQLVSHGVSKCLLFMLVGDVMSGAGGSQASNCVYMPRMYGSWGLFGLFSIILGLSGVPFIGVFFTKHFLLTTFSSSLNVFLFSFTLLCVFLSYFYSFRLCSVLSSLQTSIPSGVLFSFSSGLMVYFWLMINCFIAGSLDEVTGLGLISSSWLISFQLVSCITAYAAYSSTLLSNWSSSIFGCDNIVEACYSLYGTICNSVSLFFFRWDNYSISLFQGQGLVFTTLFNYSVLNFIMLSLGLFLMLWFILS